MHDMVELDRGTRGNGANYFLPLAAVACSLLAYFTPLADIIGNFPAVKSWTESSGSAGPFVFVLASALLTAAGFPRLLFCSLAGFLFDFWLGLLWSHLGTLIGAYGTFLFARWTGPAGLLEKYPRFKTLATRMENHGWFSVLLIRQLPLSGLYNDILLGLSAVGHRDFWIGTALGFLPLGVTATLVGAGIVQANLPKLAEHLGLAAVLFLALTLGLKFILSQKTIAPCRGVLDKRRSSRY